MPKSKTLPSKGCNGDLAGVAFCSYFRSSNRVRQTFDIGEYARSFQLLYDHSIQSLCSYSACHQCFRDTRTTTLRASIVGWSSWIIMGCFALDHVYRLQVRGSVSCICRYPYVPGFRRSSRDTDLRRNPINLPMDCNPHSCSRSVLYII